MNAAMIARLAQAVKLEELSFFYVILGAMKAPSAQVTQRSYLRAELIAALLAALGVLLLLSLANGRAWPLIVDIGGRDHWMVERFHEPERIDELNFRWTTGDSLLLLPDSLLSGSALLILDVRDGRATPEQPRRLRIEVDGQPLGELTLLNNQRRDYYLIVPQASGLQRFMTVRLLSDAPLEHEGGRELGVALLRVALAPATAGPAWPSLWLMLNGLALGGLSYSALRLAGGTRRAALLGATALGLILAVLLVTRPSEVLPFIQRFSGLAAVACLGLGLVRLLLLPRAAGPQAQLSLPGQYLPVVLALSAWMALLFQQLMLLDGARGIGSPPWMLATGLALGGSGLLWLAWRTWRDRSLALEVRRIRLARPVLLALAVAAGVQIGFSLEYAFTRQAPDFWILYRGTRDWMRGGSLYNLEAVVNNHFGHVFKVPPFYGMFFVPVVANFDGLTGLLLHRVMNTLLIATTALIWLRMWRIPLFSLATAGLLIVFNFRPLFDTVAFGQIDVVLLFLLTLALWALREERDGLAGALVALGTLFKIYPLILLAFFVLKGRWRALVGFGLGMLVFNGLAVAVIGWEQHRIYLFEVLPRIGGTTSWVENQTISGFLARLVASPRSATIFRDPLLQLAGLAISGLLVLASMALTLRPTTSRSVGFALQYGLFMLLMVLSVPAAWMHYQTLLIVPFATLLLRLRDRPVSLSYATLLGLSFALIAFGNQWSYYDGTVMGLLTIFGVSYKLYGMLVLAALMGAAIIAESAPWRESRLAEQLRALGANRQRIGGAQAAPE